MDPVSFQSRAGARHLFTSIIDKLSNTVEPSNEPTLSSTRDAISPSSRHLFVLAHCLLPSVFLPALDILDHGLVVRCIPVTSPEVPSKDQKSDYVFKEGQDGERENEGRNEASPVYYVRSSQSVQPPAATASSRFALHHLSASSKLVYEVRTRSWNCTCVAFSLSTYHNVYHPQRTAAAATAAAAAAKESEQEQQLSVKPSIGIKRTWFTANKNNTSANDNKEVDDKEEERERALHEETEADTWEKYGWQWGGVSRGEGDGRSPPVCKHLLACMLAERGGKLFADLMVERKVTEEEMAEMAVLWD